MFNTLSLLLLILPCSFTQLCFDFMESSADGQLYCIECNPRTSSVITEFHDNPELATGMLSIFDIRARVANVD